jgi:hypothetical protein
LINTATPGRASVGGSKREEATVITAVIRNVSAVDGPCPEQLGDLRIGEPVEDLAAAALGEHQVIVPQPLDVSMN